jgi:hypothetical protein
MPPPAQAPGNVALPPPGRAAPRRVGLQPLAIAGGIAVVLGVFLPWLSFPGSSSDGFDVPLSFLWSLESGDGGIKMGIPLLVLGAAGAGLSFLPGTKQIRRLVGGLALLIVVAYVVQLFRTVGRLGGDANAFDLMGAAVYVAAAGGALLSVSR